MLRMLSVSPLMNLHSALPSIRLSTAHPLLLLSHRLSQSLHTRRLPCPPNCPFSRALPLHRVPSLSSLHQILACLISNNPNSSPSNPLLPLFVTSPSPLTHPCPLPQFLWLLSYKRSSAPACDCEHVIRCICDAATPHSSQQGAAEPKQLGRRTCLHGAQGESQWQEASAPAQRVHGRTIHAAGRINKHA